MQKNFENIQQVINQEFPEFTIFSIKNRGEGDNSKAFLINGDYIFRFPKSEKSKQQLKKEITVLPKIRPLINTGIPSFKFISEEINFVGHKRIYGEPLTSKIYHSLPNEIQIKIQKSLAAFLTQLHHIDLLSLKDDEPETMNYKEVYQDDLENARQLIYPHITPGRREIITRLFKGYFGNEKNFKYKPALIHNDFSTDHILFEKATTRVTGIIDFGDLAIGDPDYDLMYLFASFGADFITDLLQFYKHKGREALLEKLYFFSLANKLQILTGSIKEDDVNDIKDGYDNLKKCIQKYRKPYIL